MWALVIEDDRQPTEPPERGPEIIRSVRDDAHNPDLTPVEVHISTLRRGNDAPFNGCTIPTLRGVGYRIVPNDQVRR